MFLSPLSAVRCTIGIPLQEIVAGYLRYVSYVSKQTYSDLEGWEPVWRQEREAGWPAYADSTLMLSRPVYQRDSPQTHVCSSGAARAALLADGKKFLTEFRHDVQLLQEHCLTPAQIKGFQALALK